MIEEWADDGGNDETAVAALPLLPVVPVLLLLVHLVLALPLLLLVLLPRLVLVLPFDDLMKGESIPPPFLLPHLLALPHWQ